MEDLGLLSNEQIAAALERVAMVLGEQKANPFRVQSYQNAANIIRETPESLHSICLTEGIEGLCKIPSIGNSLASAISHYVHTGRLGMLDILEGSFSGERLIRSVPGIGRRLARQLHEELGIETLVDLEKAAHDGRLSQIRGFGRKRIQAVKEILAGRFQAGSRQPELKVAKTFEDVPLEEILSVDSQYRLEARRDLLPKIRPRRNNPIGEKLIPILHTQRGPRHYTALYSNTQRAQQLGVARDWVIVCREDAGKHGQWTVLTSKFGILKERRIVRGHEAECVPYYFPPRKVA